MTEKTESIQPGDFYEDCFFHPCLCVSAENGELTGVSLVDGSFPRACHEAQWHVRQLSLDEAMHWKFLGPLNRTNNDLPWVAKVVGPSAAAFRIPKCRGPN